MYSLDTTLANGSFPSKIQAMRDQLEFLKSLEDSVHQMDGDPPEIPSRTVTMHEPVADAAAADAVQGQASGSHSVKSSHGAGRGLPCKRSACADAGAVPGLPLAQVLGRDMGTADDPPPPMPPSFGNIRQRLPNILGQTRTDPLDYWNFCYRALRQSKRVMGCKEFVAAYSAWQVSEGQRPTFGHSRWWDMDRDLLLRLCTRAGVKITDGHHAKILQAFWKQHRKALLESLSAWLRSGAPQGLDPAQVPRAAGAYIRAERESQDRSGYPGWWPDHGPDLDVQCLHRSVVGEARLLDERSLEAVPENHVYFELELQECAAEKKTGCSVITDKNRTVDGDARLLLSVPQSVRECLGTLGAGQDYDNDAAGGVPGAGQSDDAAAGGRRGGRRAARGGHGSADDAAGGGHDSADAAGPPALAGGISAGAAPPAPSAAAGDGAAAAGAAASGGHGSADDAAGGGHDSADAAAGAGQSWSSRLHPMEPAETSAAAGDGAAGAGQSVRGGMGGGRGGRAAARLSPRVAGEGAAPLAPSAAAGDGAAGAQQSAKRRRPDDSADAAGPVASRGGRGCRRRRRGPRGGRRAAAAAARGGHGSADDAAGGSHDSADDTAGGDAAGGGHDSADEAAGAGQSWSRRLHPMEPPAPSAAAGDGAAGAGQSVRGGSGGRAAARLSPRAAGEGAGLLSTSQNDIGDRGHDSNQGRKRTRSPAAPAQKGRQRLGTEPAAAAAHPASSDHGQRPRRERCVHIRRAVVHLPYFVAIRDRIKGVEFRSTAVAIHHFRCTGAWSLPGL